MGGGGERVLISSRLQYLCFNRQSKCMKYELELPIVLWCK